MIAHVDKLWIIFYVCIWLVTVKRNVLILLIHEYEVVIYLMALSVYLWNLSNSLCIEEWIALKSLQCLCLCLILRQAGKKFKIQNVNRFISLYIYKTVRNKMILAINKELKKKSNSKYVMVCVYCEFCQKNYSTSLVSSKNMFCLLS